MIKRLLALKTERITLAAILVATSTLISGLLGVIKMRLLAGRFDIEFTLDSYFVAFRIPDFLSATIIAGGIMVSFLPLFSECFEKNRERAWEFANNMLNIFTLFLVLFSIIIWIFAKELVHIIAPGFTEAQLCLTVSLTRIMSITPLLFSISRIFSGILQYFHRFLVFSLAPIFYNIGIIFGILFLSNLFAEDRMIYGAAWGTVIGALLHLLIQVPSAIGTGYRYQFKFNFLDNSFIKALKLMIPRIISQISTQINLIVITAITSLIAAGSVAIFSFANNLFLFPVGIIGVSFAIVTFPTFSKSLANGKSIEFCNVFLSAFRQIVFITLPLSFMFLILRAQIVRVVLGTGEFGWTETRLTAAVLGVLSISMIFSALIPLVVRSFFSFQDTKTPAIITIFSVILNIFLSFYFVFILSENSFIYEKAYSLLKLISIDDIRIIGLAAAVSITTVFQLTTLLVLLKKKVPALNFGKTKRFLFKVTIATLMMGIATYLSLRVAVLFVTLTTFIAVFFQASFALIVGSIVYILLLSDFPEIKGVWDRLSKKTKL